MSVDGRSRRLLVVVVVNVDDVIQVDDVIGVNVVLAGKNSVDDKPEFPFPPSVGVFS